MRQRRRRQGPWKPLACTRKRPIEFGACWPASSRRLPWEWLSSDTNDALTLCKHFDCSDHVVEKVHGWFHPSDAGLGCSLTVYANHIANYAVDKATSYAEWEWRQAGRTNILPGAAAVATEKTQGRIADLGRNAWKRYQYDRR